METATIGGKKYESKPREDGGCDRCDARLCVEACLELDCEEQIWEEIPK